MPANFTAVNSEVVYGGADLLSVLADTTAPVWGAANVKTFNTNLLTILSNTFTPYVVASTMGTMFGGNWGKDDDTLLGDDGTVKGLFTKKIEVSSDGKTWDYGDDMSALNKVMRTIGVAASVYTLGTTPVKNLISNKIIQADGYFF